MRIPKFNPQIPWISLVLMRTCTTSCDLSLLLSLSSSLRWLRSPCPPLRHQACSLCRVFALTLPLPSYGCPQLSMWLGPPLSSHHCSQVVSSERLLMIRPHHHLHRCPALVVFTTFVTTWYFISLFVSLVVINLPHLECSFHDTRDSGCSIYCATPSFNCAQHRDTKCAQQGVT